MRISVNGSECYAYTAARAFDAARPTVVFVHGAANDHSVWALQSRYFAHHGYNALAVDLPGHGRSAGPAQASVEALADWLVAFVDAAGAARVALVGHSLGALAALEAAARAPRRRYAKMALLGPAVPMVVSDESPCGRARRRATRVRNDRGLVDFRREATRRQYGARNLDEGQRACD